MCTDRLLRPQDKVLVAQAQYEHCAPSTAEDIFAPYKKIMEEHKVTVLLLWGIRSVSIVYHVCMGLHATSTASCRRRAL